ncbi:hypothetical protein RZS08_21940, partial [Arthrospira platensis SPKY1]|nr:hypothetical protein [Arthrospira platensis SPKY1]
MRKSFWYTSSPAADSYALFRGRFNVSDCSSIEVRVVGASWYQCFLDSEWLLEGPLRYSLDRPEYQIKKVKLQPGEHVLTFHAHHIGVDTRILKNTNPFIWCQLYLEDRIIEVDWRCVSLDTQPNAVQRINPQLGWVE